MRTLLLVVLATLSACDGGAEGPGGPADAAEPVEDAAPAPDRGRPAETTCFFDDECAEHEYCRQGDGDGGLIGTCAAGCRLVPEACGPDRLCEPATRTCVDRPCAGHQDCAEDERCAGGACIPLGVGGCRGDADCAAVDGRPAACDPATHTCAVQYPCCADGRCSLAIESACSGLRLTRLLTCDSNPCADLVTCEEDDDCPEERWCDPDGRCLPGCRLDGPIACPADLACDPATRECAVRPCAADAECEDWQACVDGRCSLGCRQEPDNCTAPERCDAERRCRELCVADDDCPDGWCDSTIESCRALCDPPTHAGCAAGEQCVEATRRCAPGCRDDAAELDGGDDEPGRAVDLVWRDAGGRRVAQSPPRAICPGDRDLFAARLEPGARLAVDLAFDPADARLHVRLLSPEGAELARSDGRLTWPAAGEVAPPGRYLLEVAGDHPGDAAPYALAVVALSGDQVPCFPDARDPGDDAEPDAPRVGVRQRPLFSEALTGNLCPADEDWTCFAMSPEDGLEVTLLAPPGCAALAAELHAVGRLRAEGPGRPDYAAGPPALLPEGRQYRIDVAPESGGFTADTWCLRLRGAAPDVICEGYDVTLTFHRRGAFCSDQVEPNDALDQATPLDGEGPLADARGELPPGLDLEVPRNLRACPGDVDLFSFRARAGQALRAWAVSDEVDGDLTVSFLDANGQPRGDPARVNRGDVAMPEQALALAAGDGLFHIRVAGVDQGAGPYRLFVRRDATEGRCAEDLHENPQARDDDAARATALRAIEPTRLSASNGAICHPDDATTDEDWYRFRIGADETRLCITAGFRHAEGDVDLQLFRSGAGGLPCVSHAACQGADEVNALCVEGRCQAPVAAGATRNDNEFISLPRQEVRAGDYLVRLFGHEGAQNQYDLTVTLAPPVPVCSRDWRERERDNDDLPRATPLGAGRAAVCDAWICHDERNFGDWYQLDVPAGADRTVHVEFAPREDGVLLLTFVNPEDPLGVVESFELQASVQCINIRGGALPASVYVGVTADTVVADGDGRVDYLLRVVPTDLDRFPRGACDLLSGGLFEHLQWPTAEIR